ncbi:hypothetical protein [Fusobacterium sp. PH5-44]|uniref:hypothetical protein n=1 Tax=unclassified Fusobacterium TaxID=2648384 RepID=UPI003D205348
MEELKEKYLNERRKSIDLVLFIVLLFYFSFFALTMDWFSHSIFYSQYLTIIFIFIFMAADNHVSFYDLISHWYYFLPSIIGSFIGYRIFDMPVRTYFEFLNSILLGSIIYQKIKRNAYEKRLLADSYGKKWLRDLYKSNEKWKNIKGLSKINNKNKRFKSILKKSLIPSTDKLNLAKTPNVINGVYSYETDKILSLLCIKKNFARLFSNNLEKLDKIYNKNYKGNITIYYDNSKMAKVFFGKKSQLINEIIMYYDTGEKMCSCIRMKNGDAVDFLIFDRFGNILQGRNVHYYDFVFIGKNIGNNLYIPYSIIVLCSLLNTDDLIKFIEDMNKKEREKSDHIFDRKYEK